MPKDPERTLERVRSGVLRAGAVHAPPWVIVGAGAVGGHEAALVEELARELGARVEWVPAGPTWLLESIERFELDLVVGGFTETDPWRDRVAVSRPHHETGAGRGAQRHVFFLPPGENRWLLTVDRFLDPRRRTAALRSGHDHASH